MEVKNNELHFDGIGVNALAQKYDTPLYIYEAATIRKRYRELTDAIQYPYLKIHYAAKTNSNLAILRLLRQEGANVECVSKGSVLLALKAGFRPSQIVYTSNGVDEDELRFLIENKIWVNLDSLGQVEKWGQLNPNSKIGIRLNLEIGAGGHKHLKTGGPQSKFGIHMSQIHQVKALARKYGLTIAGVHQHIGSDILTPTPLIRAAKSLLKVAEQFANLEIINFGGGFGVSYKDQQKALDIRELGVQLDKILSRYTAIHRQEPTVIIEPGKYLLNEAGTLLAKVTDIKSNPGGTFISLNTGMGHLVRPAMYGAYHKIINASRVKGKNQEVIVVGNLCESGDVLGKDRLLNRPREGDLLAILTAGGHGFVMSSFYNARVRPAEILIDTGKARLIRKRQSLEEALPSF
ncbi:MAG: diaminopimelate decarboxylase [bacterium]|nr:diaminopimelate decarboxylase [bacterium]MDZ4231510.1 diaminopimelate decarboxylase [Patescibacteria group bacterium]